MNRFRLATLALALGFFSLLAADYTKKTPAEIAAEVRSGKAVIIDVREKDEWEADHLAQAKHLALSSLQKGPGLAKAKDSLPKDKAIYLHCKSGIRCLKAANLLEKQGIKTEAIKAPFDDIKAAFTEPSKDK